MAALAASVATAMIPVTAMAQDRYRSGYAGYDQRQDDWQRADARRDWRDERGGDGRDEGYARHGDRRAPVRYAYRDDSAYYDRGYDDWGGFYRPPVTYGYRCQGSGTTGAIFSALAGGLLGNGLAKRGDHTLGTLLGGGAEPLAGRAVEKSSSTADP